MVRARRLRPRQRLPLRPQLLLAAIAIFHWEAASHLGHSVFSSQTGKLPASKGRRVCPGVKQREKEAPEFVTKLAAVVRATRSLSLSYREIGCEFGEFPTATSGSNRTLRRSNSSADSARKSRRICIELALKNLLIMVQASLEAFRKPMCAAAGS